MPSIAERVATRFHRIATNISHSMAQTAAYKALRTIGEPARFRTGVITQIAKAVGNSPILVSWFQNSEWHEHSVADILGEPVTRWKDDWERRDDDELDSLTLDPQLIKAIKAAVTSAPQPDVGSVRDFGAAYALVSRYDGLAGALETLAKGKRSPLTSEEALRLRAIDLAEQIINILK